MTELGGLAMEQLLSPLDCGSPAGSGRGETAGLSLSKDAARRAKKRAADRRFQKDHRDRQKAYIKQLEESVRALKETCAADNDARVAALLAQIQGLTDKCSKLEAMVRCIKNIVREDPALLVAGEALNDQSHSLSRGNGDGQSSGSTSAEGDGRATTPDLPQQPSWGATDEFPWGGPSIQLGQDTASPGIAQQPVSLRVEDLGNVTGTELDFFSNTAAARQQNQSGTNSCGHLDLDFPDFLGDEQADADTGLLPAVLNWPNQMSLDVVPASTTRHDHVFPRPIYGPGASDPAPLFRYLPRHLPPGGHGDKILLNLLQEARAEHRHGRFDTSEPSLRRLLSQQPTDALSCGLFHYLRSYGPMPLHILLGIFWVQYLLLRVLATQADYLRVPDFLRPSALERQIPHRLCVDVFVWPDLRGALIRDSETVDPEAVGFAIVEHLSAVWSPSPSHPGDPTDPMPSLDVLKSIEKQACDSRFWKVGDGFFTNFPQFKDCRLDSAVYVD